MTEHAIAWKAGPSAQIELFSPDVTESESFRLRFSPPMRKTLRPPLVDLQLGPSELAPLNLRLDDLVRALRPRGDAGASSRANVVQHARSVGGFLYDFVLPDDVQAELIGGALFVDLGLDERLLEYPWELMYDGEDFLCCKHALGRFVNVTRPHIPPASRPTRPAAGELSVLLISVPSPQKRNENDPYFDPLPAAQEETTTIARLLTEAGAKVEVKSGTEATWDALDAVLSNSKNYFHIVHYNGHATFNRRKPRQSALILQDQNMTTGHILKFFESRPPVLFFVNACESGMAHAAAPAAAAGSWKDNFDIFGLARAFLDTDAYLLGTRWKIGDEGAASFATHFYTALLAGKSIGEAIRLARCACFKAAEKDGSGDFSWASYVYYGDPRLCFRKCEPGSPADGT